MAALPMKRQEPEAPLSLADIHAAPGHLIRRSQQIAVAIFHDELAGFGITPVQYASLVAIQDNPGIDQRTLVKLVAIDRSTVGGLLRRLEDRGLIRRASPTHNQRIKQLSITAKGQTTLAASGAAVQAAQARILAPLEPAERGEFLRLISKLVQVNNEFSRAPLAAIA